MKMNRLFSMTVAASMALGLASCASTTTPYEAYVTVDINPSVAFVMNEQNMIQSAFANNSDGEMVLMHIELENKTMNQAMEMLIDEAMNLGFIDVEAAETVVEIDVMGSRTNIETSVREQVQSRIETVMSARTLGVQVRSRVYDSTEITEAEAHDVTPLQWRLMKDQWIMEGEESLETMAEWSPEALLAKVQERRQQRLSLSAQFQAEMLAARETLQAAHQLAVNSIQALIDAAGTAVDTSEWEAEIETLHQELHTAIQAMVQEYQTLSTQARVALEVQYQARLELHEAAANAKRGE